MKIHIHLLEEQSQNFRFVQPNLCSMTNEQSERRERINREKTYGQMEKQWKGKERD